MSFVPLRFLIVAAAAGAIACGSSEPPEPPDDAPIELTDLCSKLAVADCDRLQACGALVAPVDRPACELRQREVVCGPAAEAIAEDLAAGSINYFAIAGRACRDAVKQLDCAVGLDHDFFALEECRAVLEQSMAGGTCSLGLSCAVGDYCDPGMSCPGTCTPFKTNNQTCDIGEPCDPTFFCALTERRCRARVAFGGVCEPALSGNSCEDSSFCDLSQPGTPRCIRVRGRGEGCTSSNECIVGHACIRNRCSGGEEGDTCTTNLDCLDGIHCVSGACRLPLAAGVECSATATGTPCIEGLGCEVSGSAGTCAQMKAFGEPCMANGDCYLSNCVGGFCEPAGSRSMTCGPDTLCLPGLTCEEGGCRRPAFDCTTPLRR